MVASAATEDYLAAMAATAEMVAKMAAVATMVAMAAADDRAADDRAGNDHAHRRHHRLISFFSLLLVVLVYCLCALPAEGRHDYLATFLNTCVSRNIYLLETSCMHFR